MNVIILTGTTREKFSQRRKRHNILSLTLTVRQKAYYLR